MILVVTLRLSCGFFDLSFSVCLGLIYTFYDPSGMSLATRFGIFLTRTKIWVLEVNWENPSRNMDFTISFDFEVSGSWSFGETFTTLLETSLQKLGLIWLCLDKIYLLEREFRAVVVYRIGQAGSKLARSVHVEELARPVLLRGFAVVLHFRLSCCILRCFRF